MSARRYFVAGPYFIGFVFVRVFFFPHFTRFHTRSELPACDCKTDPLLFKWSVLTFTVSATTCSQQLSLQHLPLRLPSIQPFSDIFHGFASWQKGLNTRRARPTDQRPTGPKSLLSGNGAKHNESRAALSGSLLGKLHLAHSFHT